ncbi:unnamed protein product [Camellia sinensis]
MSLLVDYNSGIICQNIHKFSLSNQLVDNHIHCRLLNASICKIHQHVIVKILVELLNTQILELWGIVHLFSLLELTYLDLGMKSQCDDKMFDFVFCQKFLGEMQNMIKEFRNLVFSSFFF